MAYEEVVHWRRNLFQVPSGVSGKSFVSELARLFQAYADSSSLESIAMKATTVMQIFYSKSQAEQAKVKITLIIFKEDWNYGLMVTLRHYLMKANVFKRD